MPVRGRLTFLIIMKIPRLSVRGTSMPICHGNTYQSLFINFVNASYLNVVN